VQELVEGFSKAYTCVGQVFTARMVVRTFNFSSKGQGFDPFV